VFPQSLNIARNPRTKPRHLYENETLNVRAPYMRSLFRDIITTDDKHAVKATAVSPTKTYTPSRERERDWIIYITDISRFVMNAITIATMKNDNGPRGARFDASCRLLSNPLQGVEHIHNSLLPRAHYRKSSRWRSRKTELSMVERTAMN